MRKMITVGMGTRLLLAAMSLALCGCGGIVPKKKDAFFTSGSREADQRAGQRMAKAQQLSDTSDKAPGKTQETKGGAVQVEERKTLFERLGSEQGINAIIDDFIPRVLQDPRVNWTRTGVERGSLFKKEKGPVWKSTPQSLAALKKHMAQFLTLAAGGPAQYSGRQIANVHQGMEITNPEFDAAVGDLKATLDHLKVPDAEQKELLSIFESTRPEIVTKR